MADRQLGIQYKVIFEDGFEIVDDFQDVDIFRKKENAHAVEVQVYRTRTGRDRTIIFTKVESVKTGI